MIHISSGALIYKVEEGQVFVVIMKRNKTNSWHLPKGTQEKNETLQETAVREIKEETGLDVEIERYIGKLDSSFTKNGEIISKETNYFLAKPVSEEFKDHDHEHDQIVFLNFNEALNHLQNFSLYEEEAKILKMAEAFLPV